MTRRPTPSIIYDVLTADATRPTHLASTSIQIDGGTQMRAALNPETVTEYAEIMRDTGWGAFPPVIVYYDGATYWLADGFHRLAAFRSRLVNSAALLIPADVRSGTRRDAILHAAGANASHGLRRTNADKRRAVETLLRDDDWAKWSNMEIARRCNVDEKTVRNVRGDLERTSEIPKSDERHGADGRITNTANIGAKPGPVPAPIPQPTPREYAAAVQAAQPARTVASYAKLCILIEDEIAPTCDLYTVDRRWLAEHIEDRLHQRDMTADPADIAQAIQDTAEEMRQKEQRERRLAVARAAAEEADRQRTVDVLPSWADEPDEPVNAYESFSMPDGRIPAAQRLITLYREAIATEAQYGALTGHFSDWLAPKRELEAMIAKLEHLIAIIQHPEEVTPAAD